MRYDVRTVRSDEGGIKFSVQGRWPVWVCLEG